MASFFAALLALPVVFAGSPLTCSNPQTSCKNTTVVADTCCFNAPGGQLLQTQFWDTSPSTGPSNSWTIHGKLNPKAEPVEVKQWLMITPIRSLAWSLRRYIWQQLRPKQSIHQYHCNSAKLWKDWFAELHGYLLERWERRRWELLGAWGASDCPNWFGALSRSRHRWTISWEPLQR